MLHQVSTPANIGRVSAFGWSMGYFGGIVLLLICYVGFIAPDVGWFGVTSEDGLNIRMVALFAAAWFAIFGDPGAARGARDAEARPPPKRVGFFASYRVLFRDLRELYRTQPAHRVLPRRQRPVPGRPGRGLHLRRRAGRHRLRDQLAPTC